MLSLILGYHAGQEGNEKYSAFFQETAAKLIALDPAAGQVTFGTAFGGDTSLSYQGYLAGLGLAGAEPQLMADIRASNVRFLSSGPNRAEIANATIGPMFLAPAIAGGFVVMPIAFELGTSYLAANYGWAQTAAGALVAKGGVGGALNLGYAHGTSLAFTGESATWGQSTGAFAAGALFAPGVLGVNTGNRIFDGATTGGLSAFGGSVIAQRIDGSFDPYFSYRYKDIVSNTGIGMVTGGIGGSVSPYLAYRPSFGNSQSFGAGFDSRLRISSAIMRRKLPPLMEPSSSSRSFSKPLTPAAPKP